MSASAGEVRPWLENRQAIGSFMGTDHADREVGKL